MKYFVLFAILGLLSLGFSKKKNASSLSVNAIKSGLYLDRAKEMSAYDFFKKRMNNQRAYKMCGMRCELISATDSFTYFGYPCDSTIRNLFKVSTPTLRDSFPGYMSIEGYHVHNTAHKFFIEKYSRQPDTAATKGYTSRIQYRDNGILVHYDYQVTLREKTEFKKAKYKTITDSVLLSKTDLSVIK